MRNVLNPLPFVFALSLVGCGLPTVVLKHDMQKDALMTKIVLASYTSPAESATLFAKVKLQEKFPFGMTRADAESTGLVCADGTPVACRFSGVVIQEMAGAGKHNFQDGSKKREVTINVEISDASSIETLKFNSTSKTY